ncbi:Glutamate dehydrogenase [uncultured archaeon]|nr:Glutamate dehydrogenase [uncultured archaeon]
MNTNPRIMGWMLDEYEKVVGHKAPGVITGKPISLGGSLGRLYSTSLGGAFVLRHYLKSAGKKEAGTTVAIQGFGNVGSHLGRILDEWGYKVIAVSDSRAGIYDPKGLDMKKIFADSERGQKISEMNIGKKISNEGLLELDADVVVPSAIENVITKKNMKSIRAKIILEMANGPITAEADDYLAKNGFVVLPDILSNAGGVIVSYFEWVQNLANHYWTEKEVNSKLEEYMANAFRDVEKTRVENKITHREAAYVLAVKRILQAEADRGRIRQWKK